VTVRLANINCADWRCRVPAGEDRVVAIAGRFASGMMVMGYLSAIIHDKEGAANHKAGAVGGGYHSACLTAYGARAQALLAEK